MILLHLMMQPNLVSMYTTSARCAGAHNSQPAELQAVAATEESCEAGWRRQGPQKVSCSRTSAQRLRKAMFLYALVCEWQCLEAWQTAAQVARVGCAQSCRVSARCCECQSTGGGVEAPANMRSARWRVRRRAHPSGKRVVEAQHGEASMLVTKAPCGLCTACDATAGTSMDVYSRVAVIARMQS